MSASREKKSRQGKFEELTEKQLKAREEAARAKRNSVVYTIIGVVCALLVAALLIWNSGVFQNRAAAVTVGDESFTAAEVNYYYNEMRMQYYYMSLYGAAGDYDPQTDPALQTYDAETKKTWHDFFVDEAIKTLTEVKVVNDKAAADGVTLSEEGQQSVKDNLASLVAVSANNGYSTVNSYLKAAYGTGMNKSLFKRLLTESALSSEVINGHTDALTYTDEQLEAYYAEHTDELDIFTFEVASVSAKPEKKTNEDGTEATPTDEDKAAALEAARTIANNITASVKSGKSFADAAGAYAEDTRVTYQEPSETAGEYLSALMGDWIKAAERQAGDVTVLVSEDQQTCYAVQFVSRARDVEVPGDIRHILVAAEQDEGATAPTDAQYDAAKTKAEELLNSWKSGAATEESFAELAKAESADPGSAANGGLYENVSSATGFIPEFTEWTIDPARQVGDTGLVKNTASSTKGWHILYYCAKGEPVWKQTVTSRKANEETTQWLDTLTKDVTVERLDLSGVR